MEDFNINGQDGIFNPIEKLEKHDLAGTAEQNNIVGDSINCSIQPNETVANNLPVKTNFWTKVKSFLFQEIKVELTPKQQEFENRMNEVLHQEVSFKKVHDFLFQEIKFGK